jgi:hypothetical protein
MQAKFATRPVKNLPSRGYPIGYLQKKYEDCCVPEADWNALKCQMEHVGLEPTAFALQGRHKRLPGFSLYIISMLSRLYPGQNISQKLRLFISHSRYAAIFRVTVS